MSDFSEFKKSEKNDILFTFLFFYENLKASISVPGGLGGCLNTILSLCVNQLSDICSIKQICGGRQLVDSDYIKKISQKIVVCGMFLIWNSKIKLWRYFLCSDPLRGLGDTVYRVPG